MSRDAWEWDFIDDTSWGLKTVNAKRQDGSEVGYFVLENGCLRFMPLAMDMLSIYDVLELGKAMFNFDSLKEWHDRLLPIYSYPIGERNAPEKS